MRTREIADDLGVDALVEAELFPLAGGQLRIVARLIDGESEGSLWSGSFEARVQDIIDVSRQVVGAIARETRMVLSAENQTRLASQSQPLVIHSGSLIAWSGTN